MSPEEGSEFSPDEASHTLVECGQETWVTQFGLTHFDYSHPRSCNQPVNHPPPCVYDWRRG
jgi:hypothetical protein